MASRAVCLLVAVLGLVSTGRAQNISPPSVQLVDDFGVNLMNGQVNRTLDTIAIGGPLGLSHRISMYTNHFFPLRYYGYHDKFNGGARYVQIATNTQVQAVMRVYDFLSTVDFRVYVNGVVYNGPGPGPTSGYTFVPLRDERDRLVVAGANGEYLDWTKPDGTVSRFLRVTNAPLAQEGRLVQVTYPTGFTVYVDLPYSVSTNTGYALVYQYEADTRPVPICQSPTSGVPPANTETWAQRNPRHIKAVNSAVCTATSPACLARTWATATFTWPAGMPRPFYCGESVFEVQTPEGTTTFRYKPYDLAYNGTTLVQGYTPGARISPRLYKIKPANSTVESIEYTYKNLFQVFNVGVREDVIYTQHNPGTFPTGMGSYELLVQESGGMVSARLEDRGNGYDIGAFYMGEGASQNLGTLNGGTWRVILNVASIPTLISQVDTERGQILYESSLRNFPYQIRHNNGLSETYVYTRGNVSEVQINGVAMKRATYPPASACDNNPKTCNQPTSTFDANNNETKYRYHEASGQVSRITPPADQFGKVAETRIDYQQLRARYFDASGNRVEGAPVYLKVAERRCLNSNYASLDDNAACGTLNDELITRFEYNSNNLQLTSEATTDPTTGRTARTCYQYDNYGNKIGQTQPKGAANCR